MSLLFSLICICFFSNKVFAQYYSYTIYWTSDCTGNPYSIEVINDTNAVTSQLGTCQALGPISLIYKSITAADLAAVPNINRPSAIATYYKSAPCDSSNPNGIYGYSVTFSNTDGANTGSSVFSCNGTNGNLGFTDTYQTTVKKTLGECQAFNAQGALVNGQVFAVTQCKSGVFFKLNAIVILAFGLLSYFIMTV
jgi:hypothetical protein